MTTWADDPTVYLRSVTDQVSGMESAVVTGDLAAGAPFADALVAVTTELLDALDLDLKRDPEKDADLVSTLRVYRNAAFVYRKLVSAGGETEPALMTVCAALIEQGHDHMRTLEGQTPGRGQSTD